MNSTRKVPKKNISSHLADVRRPEMKESADVRREGSVPSPSGESKERGAEREEAVSRIFEKYSVPPPVFEDAFPRRRSGPSRRRKIIVWFGGIALFVGGGFFTFRLYYVSRLESLRAAAGNFQEFHSALGIPGGAGDSSGVPAGADSTSFSSRLQDVVSLLKNAGAVYADVQSLSSHGFALLEEASYLKNNFLELLLMKRGNELVSHLGAARDHVAAVNGASSRFARSQSAIKNILPLDPAYALALQIGMRRIGAFLDAFVPWFAVDGPHRILVFLSNTSEMRPGGGFLGSYAEVTIRKGNIESVIIRDINEADKEFDAKIIPPAPLQLIARRWRAADANWFFDFSDSAAKTISFLEQSNLYRASSTTFDGAISISPAVARDILSITGPLSLASGSSKFASDTFQVEIQKRVQAAQEKKSGEPKRVMKEFVDALTEKLSSLDPKSRAALADLFPTWIAHKDIMAYFKDKNFENFFDAYDAAGKIFAVPQGFFGDYLAFASANIGGEKSDLYIKQNVSLESQIGQDGVVSDHLVITRAHRGNESPYWWYRAPNQSYLQIFTPPGAKFLGMTGGIEKKISPPVHYAKEGYAKDVDLAAVESSVKTFFNFPSVQSFTESGKNVFATWVRTPLRGTSTVTFDYSHRLPNVPADGGAHTFVFEKQAGSSGTYHFSITAPVGFRFKENGLPVFEYDSSDPPGRVMINLTLEKIL